MRSPLRLLPFLAAMLVVPLASRIAQADGSADFVLCQQATAAAEHLSGVPDQLLDAISRVESGRYDPVQRAVRAWPWTINEEGQGHFYETKAAAVAAAMQFRAQGVQSMDVGCTQINLMFHPDAFPSLDQAFDPGHNATYAARFLTDLFHQVGSWPHAAAAYHSQTPELGTDYQRKVLAAWADPIDARATSSPADPTRSRQHGSDFHHQLASLYDSPLPGSPQSAAGRPFSGTQAAAAGGFARVMRSGIGHLSGITGRTLSAYRAMPVAMLAPRPLRPPDQTALP